MCANNFEDQCIARRWQSGLVACMACALSILVLRAYQVQELLLMLSQNFSSTMDHRLFTYDSSARPLLMRVFEPTLNSPSEPLEGALFSLKNHRAGLRGAICLALAGIYP